MEPFLNRKGAAETTCGFETAALLTAGAWLSRDRGKSPTYAIQFEDRWTGMPAQLQAWAADAQPPRLQTNDSAPVEITRGLSLTGQALNVWLQTPNERAAIYLQWFSQVSLDVQTALRRWMPYLMLREEAVLKDPALRNSLLFYAATRPYLARVRGVFTWDVICPDSMASLYRSGSQNVAGLMEQAQRYALAGGHTELAEKLAPSEMRQVMIHVRRDPRALKGLLAMEGKLVEAVLALGAKGNEITASKTAPKNTHRFCSEWARGVQTKLRRTLGAVSAPRLVDLALVEATASMACCAGIALDKREWTAFNPASTATKIDEPAHELPLAA